MFVENDRGSGYLPFMSDKKTPSGTPKTPTRAQMLIPAQAGQKVHFTGAKQGGVNVEGEKGPTKPPPRTTAPAAAPPRSKPPTMIEKAARAQPPAQPAKAPNPVADAATEAAQQQSKVLVEAVTDSFMNRLVAEANRHGGALKAEHIKSLSQEFNKKAEALEHVFQNAFADFGQLLERQQINKARNDHFDRLMVRQISSLFPPREATSLPEKCLSRRIVPGFLRCMEQMVGLDASVGYQDQARHVVEQIQAKQGTRFDWEDVYENPEARRMVRDVLMHILPFFAALKRRQEWFLNIVNNHLRPFDIARGDMPDEEDWKLTPAGFRLLARTLFSLLEESLHDPKDKAELSAAFGEGAVTQAKTILGALK
ncbi:hypothetical protein JCM17960_15480 [Magnetospira thiophila]